MPYKNGDSLFFKEIETDSISIVVVTDYSERVADDLVYPENCPDNCAEAIEVQFKRVKGTSIYFPQNYFVQKCDEVIVASGSAGPDYDYCEETNPFFYFDKRASSYINSLEIAGKTYYNVYEYTTLVTSYNIKKLYVAKGYGIVRVVQDDGMYDLIHK